MADGKLRRLHDSQHHRKRNGNGWYWLRELPSGLLIGRAGSWWANRGKFDWNSRDVTTYSPADSDSLKKQIDRTEAERVRRYRDGVALAERVWTNATPCSSHPYLARKNVSSFGLRVDIQARLIIPLRDLEGNLQGVQRIDAAGDKRFTKGTNRQKPSCHIIGSVEGSRIALVAEGYATGATLHQATGFPVVVAFDATGLKTIAVPLRHLLPRTLLVFCGDNDLQERGATGQKAAYEAARRAGGIVLVPSTDGHDWNDHAAAYGMDDVRQRVDRATIGSALQATVTLTSAEATLDRVTAAFFAKARGLAQEEGRLSQGVNISMGAGKSFNARAAAARLLASDPNQVVHFFLPLHRLIEESVGKLREENNIHAAVWRGMDQEDPEYPDGRKMCIEDKLVLLGRRAGFDQSEVCAACPSFDACGYQRQKGQHESAWFVAHNLAFHPRPDAIPAPTVKVFDEKFYTAGIVENVKLAASSLESDLLDIAHAGDREMLLELRGLLLQALRHAAAEASPDRRRVRLARRHLNTAGLAAHWAPEAARIEWLRKPTLKSVKGEDADALATRLKSWQGRFSPQVPVLWELVAGLAVHDESVNIEVEPEARLEGGEGTGLVVHLQYRLDIHPSWSSPTLILDGTAEQKINEKFFPDLEQLPSIEVEAPHMHVEWICGSFAKHRLALKADHKSGGMQRRKHLTVENTLVDIQHFIEIEAAWMRRTTTPQVLVVTHIATEKLLVDSMRKLGTLPDNVAIEHFNNMRGVDAYGNVGCIIVIGRPLPSAVMLHRRAEILEGRSLTADDPTVDAVRRSICESELLQDVGRARAIRRTEANPLRVVLMNDVPLPLPVEKITPWEQAKAHPLDLLAARGVVLDCDPDAKGYWEVVAAVLSDRFKDVQAAWDWSRRPGDNLGTGSKAHAGKRLIDIHSLGKSQREAGTLSLNSPAKVRMPAGRYWIPARIDLTRLERLKGILEVELIEPADAPAESAVGPRARMLEAKGAALINPGHAVRAFPDLWPIEVRPGEAERAARTRAIDNAKKALARDTGQFSHSSNRIGYALYREETRRAGRPASGSAIYFDIGRAKRPGKWLARSLLPEGGVTLERLHSPARPDGGVRCPISGFWDFAFAPINCPPWDDVQDEGGGMVKSRSMETDDMTDSELASSMLDASKTNPEWFDTLVAMGADAEGASMDEVNRVWALAEEAFDVAADETVEPRRRELCEDIGASLVGGLVWLAMQGQRFVSQCVATVDAERPHPV